MSFSCHSEYHPIKSLCILPVTEAFKGNEKLREQWATLNYLSQPDFEKAKREYASFRALLENDISDVLQFQGSFDTTIDAIYCRDASIATDQGMIICNMGKAGRSGEPEMQQSYYNQNQIPVLGSITAPGTVEGGDVAWLNEKTLAVGLSYRTNIQGIDQLAALLSPFGIEILVVDLPHFKGPDDVFHLMSILSPIDEDLAVVYPPLMPIRFRKQMINMGYKFIEVPDSEFESMGCNVLAIAPRKCIMLKGNPKTEQALIEAGCEVLTYTGYEISVKAGGGPTCLTRPIKRKL